MATEKRLIDANKFKRKMKLEFLDRRNKFISMKDLFECVDDMDTVDDAEVKHALWLDKTEVVVKPPYPPLEIPRVDCSSCGHIFWHTSALSYNYCPNCGAKMDGDKNG